LKVVKLEGITSSGETKQSKWCWIQQKFVKPEDLATIIYTSGQQVDQKELCFLTIISFQTY
jgi:long-subunit acyl-CoA synthetase (AMP-forming)